MIKMPNDYDTARAYDGQGASPLSIGPHICRIVSAKQETSRNGNPMLVVAFDIAENGPDDGYYKAQYDRKRAYNADAKWPGIFRTGLTNKDGGTSGFFKGLITSVEESNTGYSFKAAGYDENSLKGKLVGFNFGEEEWRKRDNSIGVSVKPFYAVSVGRVREGIAPPPRKVLNDQQAQMERQGFTPVENDDDELPFD